MFSSGVRICIPSGWRKDTCDCVCLLATMLLGWMSGLSRAMVIQLRKMKRRMTWSNILWLMTLWHHNLNLEREEETGRHQIHHLFFMPLFTHHLHRLSFVSAMSASLFRLGIQACPKWSQVDSSKPRCEYAPKKHQRCIWDLITHTVFKCSRPHVTTFFQHCECKCVLCYIQGQLTQLTPSAKQRTKATAMDFTLRFSAVNVMLMWRGSVLQISQL